MEFTIITTEKAPAALGPYSAGIIAGEFVYTSGQLPINPETGGMPDDIGEQTRQSLRNIASILDAAELSMDDVIKTTVFLKNMNDFSKINSAYGEFFSANFPARSAVEVSNLPKGASVEIEAIAYKKK